MHNVWREKRAVAVVSAATTLSKGLELCESDMLVAAAKGDYPSVVTMTAV